MDLGFGDANQVMGSAMAGALLQNAKAQEAALDSQLDEYDALLDDDDALDMLRERRLAKLKQQQKQQQKWIELGHGTYEEMASTNDSDDVAKAFFEASKASTNLVIHFGRPTNPYCAVIDMHLNDISKSHLETKFAKINVETAREGNQGLTYLVEKLGITVLPTLVLIHKRKAVHHIMGLNELGGTDQFSTQLLKFVLSSHNVLTLTESEMDMYGDDEMQHEIMELREGGGKSSSASQSIRRGIYDIEDM
mmetsp:Transcript_5392/g.6283  ORF Transcript_5392/g.6283 Transcript_5392/m.6283 type:complete len:250 (+) Transcript_5392:133-882(+)|eukprot:CAMPEP_0194185144 /NCGR_PEP_ID=MMETSP0154-20130528/41289_1 /TAXON_ID=1049557 /ORGANISM="Thalassiothrix antarctica, Strain L6-D1" /LENGTH=249 /DNA_ID=CAMNT_0038903259 /DNA_START=63 /DNA_END=812 /DNA_ORIENTATION=+